MSLPRRPVLRSAVLMLALAGLLSAAEHDAPPGPKAMPAAAGDLLTPLPALPKPLPKPAAALGPQEELAPGVRIVRGACVVLDGVLNIDQGPVDGLEVFACLKDGKNHEALVRLDTTAGQVVKVACIAALGLPDGQPAEESSGLPARGAPVTLTVRWTPQGATDEVELPASCLVRDRVVDRPYAALAWPYTGSRFQTVLNNGPNGRPVKREVFMLDATRSIAVNFDEADALIASPFPGSGFDQRFETYSAVCPPKDTPVRLVIGLATLPLVLTWSADGALHDAAGAVLDDAALAATLAKVYGPGAEPALRNVQILVPPDTDHHRDEATRARVLAAAAAAKAWVVPLFTPLAAKSDGNKLDEKKSEGK